MNPFVGVYIKDDLLLLTHEKELRSMGLLEATRRALYRFSSLEARKQAFPETSVVHLFDGRCRTLVVRRSYRYVHRTGQAHFAEWLPKEVLCGVAVYGDSFQGPAAALEIANNFLEWSKRIPRKSHGFRTRLCRTASYSSPGLWMT